MAYRYIEHPYPMMIKLFRLDAFLVFNRAIFSKAFLLLSPLSQNGWIFRKLPGGSHLLIKKLCCKFAFILRLYLTVKPWQSTPHDDVSLNVCNILFHKWGGIKGSIHRIHQTGSNSLFVIVYDCLQYIDLQKLASLRVILAEDFNYRKTVYQSSWLVIRMSV